MFSKIWKGFLYCYRWVRLYLVMIRYMLVLAVIVQLLPLYLDYCFAASDDSVVTKVFPLILFLIIIHWFFELITNNFRDFNKGVHKEAVK